VRWFTKKPLTGSAGQAAADLLSASYRHYISYNQGAIPCVSP